MPALVSAFSTTMRSPAGIRLEQQLLELFEHVFASRRIGGQEAQRELSIMDAAEHFVESAVHVRRVADQTLQVFRDAG